MKQLIPYFLIAALAGCTTGGPTPTASTAPDTSEIELTGTLEPVEGAESEDRDDPLTDAAEPELAAEPERPEEPEPPAPEPEPQPEPEPEQPAASDDASSGTTTPAPAADGRLGSTTASLGDPNEAGFWLKTPLVSAPQPGRVEYPATGRSVQVQLIPSSGSGSEISIAAMRLLEGSLTDVLELVVYAN